MSPQPPDERHLPQDNHESIDIPKNFLYPNVWILSQNGEGSPSVTATPDEIQEADTMQRTGRSTEKRYLVDKTHEMKGAMGTILTAYDLQLRTTVILKCCTSHDDEYIQKFVHETQLMAQIGTQQPHILRVFTFIPDSQLGPVAVLMHMDTERQPTVSRLLKRKGPLDHASVVHIIEGTADAVDYLWKKGKIVHYDLKPANIFYNLDTDEPIVGDFGLAGEIGSIDPTTFGTPAYMSPERISFSLIEDTQDISLSSHVDVRSEIYSLAVIAYELLTGKRLFNQEVASDIMLAVLTNDTENIVNQTLPKSVALVINRALQTEAKKRYSSALEFAEELAKALGVVHTLKRPRR